MCAAVLKLEKRKGIALGERMPEGRALEGAVRARLPDGDGGRAVFHKLSVVALVPYEQNSSCAGSLDKPRGV